MADYPSRHHRDRRVVGACRSTTRAVLRRCTCATLFADDPGRADALTATGADLVLDYSKHRITRDTLPLLTALARRAGLPERIEAMFAGRAHQHQRGPGGAAHGAARAAGRSRSPSTARTCPPTCTPCWPDGASSPTRCAPGSGPGTPASGSAPWSTSASAARTSARSWPTRRCAPTRPRRSTMRFVSNIDPTDVTEAAARPRPGDHAVHRLVQDVHHAGDADQRQRRPAVAGRGAAATSRRSPSTSSRCRRTPRRSQRSASTRPTCSASGTGWAGATRSTPRSGSRSWSRSARSSSASSSPACTRWTRHFRTAPLEENLPVDRRACSTSGTSTSSAPRRTPCCPTASTCTGSPPTCSS